MAREFDPKRADGWPAFSVRQPWAHFILTHQKFYENRSWETRYRGPMWLHAGVRRDPLAPWLVLPTGAVIGVIGVTEIVGLRPAHGGPMDTLSGPLFWKVHPIATFATAVPCLGKLNLFALPADVLALCRRQLPR